MVRTQHPAESLNAVDAPHRKLSPLIVGQSKSSATELSLQNSILLAEVLDDRILLVGDPAGQGGDEDLPRLEDDGHRLIVVTLRGER